MIKTKETQASYVKNGSPGLQQLNELWFNHCANNLNNKCSSLSPPEDDSKVSNINLMGTTISIINQGSP